MNLYRKTPPELQDDATECHKIAGTHACDEGGRTCSLAVCPLADWISKNGWKVWRKEG